MTGLEVFTFRENVEVRVFMIDGDARVIAVDIANALSLGNVSSSLALLDEDEKGLHSVETLRGPQMLAYVTEAGMYSLILRSRKPEAKAFKRWITHEVLPTIRRTGAYSVAPEPSFEVKALEVMTELQRRVAEAETQVAVLESPARAWNALADAEGDYLVSEAAKILGREIGVETGPRKLFDFMEGQRWIFRRGGRPVPYQDAVNAGLLAERVTTYFDRRTNQRKVADPQVRVTPRGLERLLSLLTDQALELTGQSTQDVPQLPGGATC